MNNQKNGVAINWGEEIWRTVHSLLDMLIKMAIKHLAEDNKECFTTTLESSQTHKLGRYKHMVFKIMKLDKIA